MPQPGPDKHHGRIAIREAADDARPPLNFFHDSLQAVVGAYLEPMLRWEVYVGQGLPDTLLDKLGDSLQLHAT